MVGREGTALRSVEARNCPKCGTPTRSLSGLVCGVLLTTMMPDGQPQSSLVWCDYDGECARVNTTAERQKGRNMRANPHVTLLVVDPDDTTRYLALRGQAQLVEDGALTHLDEITRAYTTHPAFYGYVYPLEQRDRETRMICASTRQGSPSTPYTGDRSVVTSAQDDGPVHAASVGCRLPRRPT
ncbi:MAG TPA: TIGR03618 family F420-dependent PPOX class oxidoreductase [Ilumatobacteraceae bacterium]|nr:TIGR03618 family F420-dependent PPOX class oxidoreductase [Ilumatobacteraceae bacterium]